MISEWDAEGVFLCLWAKQCWDCTTACFALESTALGKCCIRAGASAQYLHVFVMSDNLVHAYAAQKTFVVGMSWSRFTSEKRQALLQCSYRRSFVSTARALRAFPVLTVPTQPALDPHPCPWDHISAPPRAISACCRTQAHVVGLPPCSSLTTMPVPGHGPCWIGPRSVGCLPSLTLDLTLSLCQPGPQGAWQHPDTTQEGACPTEPAASCSEKLCSFHGMDQGTICSGASYIICIRWKQRSSRPH